MGRRGGLSTTAPCASAGMPYRLHEAAPSGRYNQFARPTKGARTPIATTVRPAETDHEIGIGRRARRAHGFDQAALGPRGVALNPAEGGISFGLGPPPFSLPLPASALDGVVGGAVALAVGRRGGP